MNFLRDLFRRQRPSEHPDLEWHDRRIQALERTALKLEQVNSEPMTARIRGQYARRVLPARSPHRTEPTP